jgi:glycosyltransferase involved in cell wall biosynthesis
MSYDTISGTEAAYTWPEWPNPELPFISCKCTTYGRTDLLVESLYSFLTQDYPKDKCELVIVNDYPKQKLHYNHPQVRIYNLDTTFPILGNKENFAIERCKGPLIAVWDDDDVALPHHLSNIAKYWRKDTNIIHWETGVFYNEPKITAIRGVGNSGIVYSKDAWERIGRSPIENAGGDMTLVRKLHALGGKLDVKMRDEDAAWFYMWGGRGYHQSGMGTDDGSRPDIVQRHSEFIEKQRIAGNIPTGDIYLEPKWNHDYKQMLEDYVNQSNNS